MNLHRLALSFALLAVLSASEAIASHQAAVPAGEAQLAFPPEVLSSFAIDLQTLAETYCGPLGKQTNLAKCQLVSRPSGIAVGVPMQRQPAQRPAPPPQWQVTGIDLTSSPVATSCGPWEVSLRLDAIDPQPASPTLSGIFRFKAHLHFFNPATGQVADDPLVPGASGDDPTEPGDCLPDWIVGYPDLLKEYEAMGCELCDGSDSKRSTGRLK
ncbi:MAG TPA: hypothetical protein VIE43_26280 [Thermoanaerobaculia bacterium]|jgi:hypothetical protein|nr:hypothetical protein [Thermoanaerobaculia bacterium]